MGGMSTRNEIKERLGFLANPRALFAADLPFGKWMVAMNKLVRQAENVAALMRDKNTRKDLNDAKALRNAVASKNQAAAQSAARAMDPVIWQNMSKYNRLPADLIAWAEGRLGVLAEPKATLGDTKRRFAVGGANNPPYAKWVRGVDKAITLAKTLLQLERNKSERRFAQKELDILVQLRNAVAAQNQVAAQQAVARMDPGIKGEYLQIGQIPAALFAWAEGRA